MWTARPVTPSEAAEDGIIDRDGQAIPLYVVISEGEDVTGPLTAATIKRYFGLEIQ